MRQLIISLFLAATLCAAPAALAVDFDRLSLGDLVSEWFEAAWDSLFGDAAADEPQAVAAPSESVDDTEPPTDEFGGLIIPGS